MADLRDDKFHDYIPPTLSIPLGYLMPGAGFREWNFCGEAFNDVAQEMVGAVATYAVPFIRRMSDLPGLCVGMKLSASGWCCA